MCKEPATAPALRADGRWDLDFEKETEIERRLRESPEKMCRIPVAHLTLIEGSSTHVDLRGSWHLGVEVKTRVWVKQKHGQIPEEWANWGVTDPWTFRRSQNIDPVERGNSANNGNSLGRWRPQTQIPSSPCSFWWRRRRPLTTSSKSSKCCLMDFNFLVALALETSNEAFLQAQRKPSVH